VPGKHVATWYKYGKTRKSIFGGAATAYEECIVEPIGLFLSSDPFVLGTLVGDAMDHETGK
jgi:hypothetical protein